jgi:5'-3' exonuclease
MLNSRDGIPTNVIMGFMNMLERLEREYKRTLAQHEVTAPSAAEIERTSELSPHYGLNRQMQNEASVSSREACHTECSILKSSNKAGKKNKVKSYYQPSLFDEEPCIEKTSSEISGVTIVFDAPGKTFRHEAYPEYKQTRKPTPPEFKPQIPLLIELLQYLGYPVVMIEGVEADDTIASASRIFDSTVVSSDKDLLQILRPGVEILRPIKGVSTFNRYDVAAFTEEYGFPPESMPDYLALLGDTVDNLPGVPGIGEKTALQLIGSYKTIENLLKNTEELKPSHKKNLKDNREQVYATRELNRLKFDVKLDLSLFEASAPNCAAAISLCEKLDLKQICNRIVIMQQKTQ